MKKIADLRALHNISQEDLAKIIKVKQPTVSRWEINQLNIQGKNLIALANFFDVSADDLLGIKHKEK